MIKDEWRRLMVGGMLVILLGTTQAWSKPLDSGWFNLIAYTFVILITYLVITYPYIHWALFLLLMQEGIYILANGQWVSLDIIFNHWSHVPLGFNFYPWIILPIVILTVELIRCWKPVRLWYLRRESLL